MFLLFFSWWIMSWLLLLGRCLVVQAPFHKVPFAISTSKPGSIIESKPFMSLASCHGAANYLNWGKPSSDRQVFNWLTSYTSIKNTLIWWVFRHAKILTLIHTIVSTPHPVTQRINTPFPDHSSVEVQYHQPRVRIKHVHILHGLDSDAFSGHTKKVCTNTTLQDGDADQLIPFESVESLNT